LLCNILGVNVAQRRNNTKKRTIFAALLRTVYIYLILMYNAHK
jgi:hypothetical protein